MLTLNEIERKLENMNENQSTNNEQLIDQPELARLCKVTKKTIQNWQKKGLPNWRANETARPRYRYSEVLVWLRQKGKSRV